MGPVEAARAAAEACCCLLPRPTQGGETAEEDSWVQCSWESDEEVQERLNAFIDRLRKRLPNTPHI